MEWSHVLGAYSWIGHPIHYYEEADKKFTMGAIVECRGRRSLRSLFFCLVVAIRFGDDNGENLGSVLSHRRRADTRDVE